MRSCSLLLLSSVIAALGFSSATAAPDTPKVEATWFPKFFENRRYSNPEHVITEMKGLVYPWNYVFMAPPREGKPVPEGYRWEMAETLHNDGNFVCVAAGLSVRQA